MLKRKLKKTRKKRKRMKSPDCSGLWGRSRKRKSRKKNHGML
jgi:hypothetical protein